MMNGQQNKKLRLQEAQDSLHVFSVNVIEGYIRIFIVIMKVLICDAVYARILIQTRWAWYRYL